MKLDCYAVLGLSPAAEDAVIRAAYLALMRSYHPDKNGSPEAAARVRAITAAYKTIGDPVRRAEYDAGRWDRQFEILGYDHDAKPGMWAKMSLPGWPKARVAGAAAASALAILLAVMVVPKLPTAPRVSEPAPIVELKSAALTKPAAANSNQRQKEQPTEAAPTASPVPIEIAPPKPPADLQAAEKAREPRPQPALAATKPAAAVRDTVPKPRLAAQQASPRVGLRPAKASTVDQKSRVALLESMSSSFYNQSFSHADEAGRSQLKQARDQFVSNRNACRTDSCIGDAHASYIRDISNVMDKSAKPHS